MPKKIEADDSPLDRALAIAAPSGDQREWCLHYLQFAIVSIASTPPRRSMVKSMQLKETAIALRKMHRAIEKLDLADQFFLLSAPPFNLQFQESLDERLFDNRVIKRDATALLGDLDRAAATAMARSMALKVSHAERRRDYQKFTAAFHAHQLLIDLGKRPALTYGGDFLELTSTLYEAATGKIGVDLRSHCRSVSAELKQK
jgi:hypothetical protein